MREGARGDLDRTSFDAASAGFQTGATPATEDNKRLQQTRLATHSGTKMTDSRHAPACTAPLKTNRNPEIRTYLTSGETLGLGSIFVCSDDKKSPSRPGTLHQQLLRDSRPCLPRAPSFCLCNRYCATEVGRDGLLKWPRVSQYTRSSCLRSGRAVAFMQQLQRHTCCQGGPPGQGRSGWVRLHPVQQTRSRASLQEVSA